MGISQRVTATAVALIVAAEPAAAHAMTAAGDWKTIRTDRRDSYDAVTVTPGGAVWVAGARDGKPLLLKGRSTFKQVTGPGFRVKRLASASDTRVWAFGTSKYARWDGKRWQVKPWKHGRVDRAYSIGANLWVVENVGYHPKPVRSTLRRLTGSTWRKVPTPIVVKGLDGKWAAGSAKGKAALARWTGTAWRAVPLPALPSSHLGQRSELTDVAVDGETGRVMAVGWAAWPCGAATCGETLLLTGYLGDFAYQARADLGVRPRAQAEPDGRGGAWIAYSGNRYLHIKPESVETGAFPSNQPVRDLANLLGSHSVWAVGGTAIQATGR
ncbi:hypothetical protein [Herbidospora daliensis]|uniref:hypothetical protein n=1 Tax=Herbidospora daliensis TaxID=295585 RepID=UPI0007834E68|nr:hypothetical protein [Herbidospora daliensis]